jgi:integrase
MKIPLFKDQALVWLSEGTNRKRNSFRPGTIKTYSSQIENHLIPLIGKEPLDTVGNKALKRIAVKLMDKGLSAATIDLNLNIVKQIRASAVDQEGAQVYPYTWNSNFIDAPVLDRGKQKTPVASAQTIQDALKAAPRDVAALLALLSSTGLRIAEALALQVVILDNGVATVWLPDESKIIVRLQRRGNVFGPTKTKAGNREIDLPTALNDYLKRSIEIEAGPSTVFPLSEGFYRLAFKKYGILGGFHSLRRFRVTHLRLNNVPDSLIHFWIGHEDESVTDRYTKVGSEIEARKTQADRAGLGFELPEIA